MRALVLPLFGFLIPFSVSADQNKTLTLRKIPVPIEVDGMIDPAWASADSAVGFFQMQPYYGQPPSRQTVAKVLTTEDALYCLIVCYDRPENIQKTTGKLDDFAGDIVSIMLDTFGDRKTAYKFAVTASGVRADSRMLDDARNRDYGWDGVWFSDSRIYDWGYVVEIEIPYRSIQYDETLGAWGLDFDRWIPGLNEDLYWCHYEENEGQRISKFGTLVFSDFRPEVKGSNLEIFPVGLTKTTYEPGGSYRSEADLGLDVFYNPSPQLTFQLTGNPDFAQIEADPFQFNISRYETYYEERRPFFTQGNEIFMPSGRERGTGFYQPLELMYTRRIGKKLPDGSEVPLRLGTKAFGRLDDWEYGGFLAMTGAREYVDDGSRATEEQAYFASARVKRHIPGNSTVGILFVGKHTPTSDFGVLDIDGAFRSSDWQLSYQIARSFKGSEGGYGGSAGFIMFGEDWITLARTRFIEDSFDIDEVGFVPWRGTSNTVALSGPRWYFDEGYVRQILMYGGGYAGHERIDRYTDVGGVLGYNMQFRPGWGFEVNVDAGKAKDIEQVYRSFSANLSSWFNTSPDWNGNLWGGYQRTFNFRREYVGYYGWSGASVGIYVLKTLRIGTTVDAFAEWNPDRMLEDWRFNARPFFSLTPVNDLNIYSYFDHVFVGSTDRVEERILGILVSFNFLPKSWIYLAVNDFSDLGARYDALGAERPARLRVADRAGVLKLKYLYYF